jgi:hydroxymethylglutaryl-CoA synthase
MAKEEITKGTALDSTKGMGVGIVAYGAYIPRMRIKVEEIARVWGKDGAKTSDGLNVIEKAIANYDEDSCTMAVEASRKAVEDFGISTQEIGAIYVGSESKPYAVKPTATIVADAIYAGPDLMAADLEFACKAGTAGIQICMGLVKSGMMDYGLAIGTDTSQGRPNDALEFSTGCGAAAFIIGRKKDEIIAEIKDTYSFTTDTPDFWRRQHAEFPRHAGRFTGKPAYFRHVISGAKRMMERNNMAAEDFDYAVFHQPNGKFPLQAAKMLGIDEKKMEQGLLTPLIGNTYSASTMLGLASILDVLKPKEKVLVVSYGSGAGSDAFIIEGTSNLEKKRARTPVKELINDKEYVDYALYIKHRRKLKSM